MRTAILLSGGLESIALAYHLNPSFGITIDYGQVCADAEIRASKKVCSELNITHKIVKFGTNDFKIGELFNSDKLNISPHPDWVPFRNQLVLTIGCIKAVELEVEVLLMGTINEDSIYKDGTDKFYKLFNDLISYQEKKLIIKSPAINMTADQLISISKIPLSILSWAHSCTKSNYPCGKCRSCLKYNRVINGQY